MNDQDYTIFMLHFVLRYKKTPGMRKIINERQKRIVQQPPTLMKKSEISTKLSDTSKDSVMRDPKLTALIHSVSLSNIYHKSTVNKWRFYVG